MLAGFFYATDASKLEVEDTFLKGTYGDVASAFYAAADSNLSIVHMSVEDLEGPEQCTYDKAAVIVADSAKHVSVEHTVIEKSGCSYIYSDRTPVSINNSNFMSGQHKNPYVSIRGSELNVIGSRFKPADVEDLTVRGRGIYCDYCTSLTISGSKFEGLKGF